MNMIGHDDVPAYGFSGGCVTAGKCKEAQMQAVAGQDGLAVEGADRHKPKRRFKLLERHHSRGTLGLPELWRVGHETLFSDGFLC